LREIIEDLFEDLIHVTCAPKGLYF